MATMIEVDNLGKKYRLGGQDKYYKTLRESLVRGLKRPFQRLAGKAPEEDEFWALRNVSFTVDEGEVVGIIGRNGAGKSTLLKLLSRITRPTEGCAKLYGRVGSLLEVGTGFHPELTGRENIYLSGNLLGMTRAEVRGKFDEIVDFSGVEKFLDTPVKHYSSGMYVRLGFAIAAHLEPEILLVDEVLAVGDAQFQKKCLGKMDEVAKSGKVVFLVSHSMQAIQRICNRAILLSSGRTEVKGSVQSVIDTYFSEKDDAASEQRVSEYAFEMKPVQSFRVWSETANGVPSKHFLEGVSWNIRVQFATVASIAGCTCRLIIHTGSGATICIYSSRPADVEVGEFAVDFSVSVPLRSRPLFIGVEFACNTGSIVWVPEATHVMIQSTLGDDLPVRSNYDPILLTTSDARISKR